MNLEDAIEQVRKLEAVVEKLPKTADGVPAYPGLHVWFKSRRMKHAEEVKVTGWDWLPRLGEGFMHAIKVRRWWRGEDDIVNLECCYSTREAAQPEYTLKK